MSDDMPDVLIAVYLVPDLAQQDLDAFLGLVEDKSVTTDGVVLVTKDAEGDVHVQETGDHAGRKGVGRRRVGLVVGLFAPPLLAVTAVGAAAGGVIGTFAKKRVTRRIAEKMERALPPRSTKLANTVVKSVAQIDKASAKELKAGLTEAQAGLEG